MSNKTIEPKRLKGKISPPADKSISHRAIIIASLAEGKTRVYNLSLCDDCLRSLQAFRDMGVSIDKKDDYFLIQGKGLGALKRPKKALYLGNSGTSMRLILGVLAGEKFPAALTADRSLSQRPMQRVIAPLTSMGARIKGSGENQDFAPLHIQGAPLEPIHYNTTVASAQVKSAILLAGLYAQGRTVVDEPAKSRDHTERMLKKFAAHISVKGLSVSVAGRARLLSADVEVPGDISAASFFLVGACICPGSDIMVEAVGLNPTRTAFLQILQEMGAELEWSYEHGQMARDDYAEEAKGKILARSSKLKGITVTAEQIPSLIDELPILMVAATQAEGETKICQAAELRVKETDRIEAMVANLSKMGADIQTHDNDIIIRGPRRLSGSILESFNDHRIAMSAAIAGLAAKGKSSISGADCVNVSFPGFFSALSELSA